MCGNGIVDVGNASLPEQCDPGYAGWTSNGCTSTCQAEARSWALMTPPTLTRGGMASAIDTHRGRWVIFGGRDAYDVNETCEFDGTMWFQRDLALVPLARAGHRMAYDAHRRCVVMFGGYGGGENLSDTWEYDGVVWQQVHPATSPAARNGHAMAYDAARQQVLMVGGALEDGLALTVWAYDGTDWQPLQVAGTPPANRSNASLTWDDAGQRLVLFGGLNLQGYLRKLGELSFAPSQPNHWQQSLSCCVRFSWRVGNVMTMSLTWQYPQTPELL